MMERDGGENSLEMFKLGEEIQPEAPTPRLKPHFLDLNIPPRRLLDDSDHDDITQPHPRHSIPVRIHISII